MKRWISMMAVAAMSLTLLTDVADARRLGGGGFSGMQRTPPPQRAPDSLPAKPAPNQGAPNQAAPTNAAGATAAAAANPARRSWMAPLAGLAAGLGIAALASALGFGPALANIVTALLLLFVGLMVVRWLMRRLQPQPMQRMATPAGGAFGAPAPHAAPAGWGERPAPLPAAASSGTAAPADFDAAGFERIAKMIFIRMQAANDAGDLDDLRRFTTPEMFAAVRLDLQERGGRPQRTDVVEIAAEVVDVAEDDGRQIVTVRFHGLLREEQDAGAQPFDELWHFAKPLDGSRDWAIAGIQQSVVQ